MMYLHTINSRPTKANCCSWYGGLSVSSPGVIVLDMTESRLSVSLLVTDDCRLLRGRVGGIVGRSYAVYLSLLADICGDDSGDIEGLRGGL